MTDNTLVAWGALLLLGALHGVNPGMGWLFAVALGLQERSGRAVWRSLLPLALGHALAVAAAVAVLVVVGRSLSPDTLRWVVAGLLATMGVLHLRRRLHPRFGGMQVKGRDLVVWSFLMASAHGAGIMALAFVPAAAVHAMGDGAATTPTPTAEPAARPALASAAPLTATAPQGRPGDAHASHPPHHTVPAGSGAPLLGVIATLVHTLGYLLTMGLIATVVYHRVGLRLLRRAWINLDVIWAGALIITAVLIPLF
jgi:hypothetical protein